MDLETAKIVVKNAVYAALEEKKEVLEDMQLIGGEALLDSMNLVQVCLTLEDEAEELGFEFDWTSESTMSRSRSMFRSVMSLAEEFYSQASRNL